jgi:hypothetical protein
VWRSYVDIPFDRLPGLRLRDDVVAYFCEGARHGFNLVRLDLGIPALRSCIGIFFVVSSLSVTERVVYILLS